MSTATMVSGRLGKVLDWAVDNSVITVFTVVGANQVLVMFASGEHAFVGELADGRFICVVCLDDGGCEVVTFCGVDVFQRGLLILSR